MTSSVLRMPKSLDELIATVLTPSIRLFGRLGRLGGACPSGGRGDRLIQIGVVTPHVTPGPEVEFPTMAPGRLETRMARVSAEAPVLDVTAGRPTPSTVRALTAPPLLDDAATMLAANSIDVIGFASASSAYAIGFDGEAALVARLSRRSGVPVAATCTSAVLALRVLEVERVALVDPPWFGEKLDALGAAYFRSQGFEVVSSASAELALDPHRIELAAVYDWTSRHVPDDAEAVFIAGNGFRAAGAIGALEATLDRPVITANQVLLWALLALAHATFEITGYGQLFARNPRRR